MTRNLAPEATVTEPFILSIETAHQGTKLNPAHLGTDEAVARAIAEEKFRHFIAFGPIVTVALMRKGRIVDVFDGEWSSQREFPQ